MSVRLMADVWDSALADATLTNVMVVLANSADDAGGNCYPGTALIARRTRYSERTVIRAIAELEREGWITLVQRGRGRPAGRSKLDRARYMSQYQINLEKLKGCQAVTVLDRPEKVTPTAGKGDRLPKKGDFDANPPHPLFGGSVLDPSRNLLPLTPSRGEGDASLHAAIERAVDQVCSALGISNRRKRKPVRYAVELAAEKGELPATIALAMIAAVRRQGDMHDRGLLKFAFGLEKFIGLGIWRDESRWGWDNEALKLRREASVGTWG